VVPAPPGGVTDVLARTLGKHFNQDWGVSPVVENRGGANNQVAAEYVMHQPADGYTLMIGRKSRLPPIRAVSGPALFAERFHADQRARDIYHGLILNPSVPVNSVKDLIEIGKTKPGSLNYGTFGVGSTGISTWSCSSR